MNCKPGDLAYVTGSPVEQLNGLTVEVLSRSAPFKKYGPAWNCTSASMREQGFSDLPIPDSMLRPISGVPLADETPIETDVPEALRLGLGIESRWSA